ncbi:MAG: S8 family serine peptidase [Butyricimonas faecihominis]
MKNRASLGDDPENVKDCFYGNGNLLAESAMHGQHVGGIVGACRDNGIGIDGVADVDLMFVRVGPGNGDEHDKEVALSVRYAVDNGARVINMSFGKPFSFITSG